MEQWIIKARDMAETGDMSWRQIARELDIPRSTVSDMLRKYFREQDVYKKPVEKKGPRILIYDVETSPLLAYCWGLWNNNVALNQLHTDFHLLSYAAKWLGEDEIFYQDQRYAKNIEDDSEVMQGLWKLLNEADFVITFNGKKFDQRKVNSRFLVHGMQPPSSYRHIDVLEICKKQFGFVSNKLEFLTNKLCTKYKKSKHAKFSGFEMWKACLEGNIEAYDEMMDYNSLDILSLEELYSIVSAWDSKLPVFEVYEDEVSDMGEWVHEGYVYSNLAKYERFRNTKTGQYRRGHVNLLSKEKRDSLLRNI